MLQKTWRYLISVYSGSYCKGICPSFILYIGLSIFSNNAFSQISYSTGCISNYVAPGCGGPDLPATIGEGRSVRTWYNMAGFRLVSAWENNDVWGTDYINASDGDIEPQGGSDLPQVYFFAGHGSCQNPPAATSPDFLITCSNARTPNNVVIGSNSQWGNNTGRLRFAFIDASCPMDLVSLGSQWFPVFQGLHVATGHSGTSTQDALDAETRGNLLAAYTSNAIWLLPHLSVGNAWMSVGTTDVQSGCCAVVIAAGNTREDAENRRDNEKVLDNWSNPVANWCAWRWVCR